MEEGFLRAIHERPEADDVRWWGRHGHRRTELAGGQSVFEFVFRQDIQVVEHAETGTEGCGKRQGYGGRIERRRLDSPSADL